MSRKWPSNCLIASLNTAGVLVCSKLEAVDDAQIEFGLFRGCLAYNKINHLLRTCPPDVIGPQ